MIAFLPSLGYQEMFLLIVIGLLLYGRNLPQAGRSLGRVVAQLKRGFQDFKEQMDRDESLREVRKTIQDTTREVKNVTAVPRALADPGRALRDLADEAIHSPPPGTQDTPDAQEQPDEPPPPDAATPAAPSETAPAKPAEPTDAESPR